MIEPAEMVEPVRELEQDEWVAGGPAAKTLAGEGGLLVGPDQRERQAHAHAVAEVAGPSNAVRHCNQLAVLGDGRLAAIVGRDQLYVILRSAWPSDACRQC